MHTNTLCCCSNTVTCRFGAVMVHIVSSGHTLTSFNSLIHFFATDAHFEQSVFLLLMSIFGNLTEFQCISFFATDAILDHLSNIGIDSKKL